MSLNPKLALKSTASIKTFGAACKVNTNHAWLLPIDENNRRCKAAGYSGLKDYFIKKGLKLTKWKDTGLIKELVTPNGGVMTFGKEFPCSKADNTKTDLKENELQRTSSCSIKKTETVLTPKRIRSLSPVVKHAPVKRVEPTAEQTNNKTKISETSINVFYKMRRSKTLSILKYDKENSSLTQERNNPTKSRNAVPLVSGKSLMCLPKVSLTKYSDENIPNSIHNGSAVKQNTLRESMSYRKFDRKNNSPSGKTSQKLEMRVTRKKCNTNNKNSRDNLSKSSNNKRSETQYSSVNVNITNTFVDTGNLECNTDSSTTSTSLSMFSARSSLDSFIDKKESVIRIDISSDGRKSPENIGTRVLYTYVADGCDNKHEEIHCNTSRKTCKDETNEKQEQNSKKIYTKNELKLVYLQDTEPAVEEPEYSKQTSNSKPKSVEASSDDQLSLESAKLQHELTENNNEKDCSEGVVSTKEPSSKADGNYKETVAELGAVEIVYPTSTNVTQKLEISNATSKKLISETTAVTLDYSDHNYSSLIDVKCTLKDVRYTLNDMRRSLEHCSETSQKEAAKEYSISERSSIEVKDNISNKHEDSDIITGLAKLENSDVDAISNSFSDCKENHGVDEFKGTNSHAEIVKVKDQEIAYVDEIFRPVLLLDINQCRAVNKANSVAIPMLKTKFPEQLFLKIGAGNSYSSAIIKKLIENPLLTQEICNSLSSAMTSNICYQLQHSMNMKRALLQEQDEMDRKMDQRYQRSVLLEVTYKDAETQTQNYFDETEVNECKIVCDNSPETLNMQAENSCKDALKEMRTENSEIDHGCRCKISGDNVREDHPETQNLHEAIYDKGEDSDEFSVYEDALELF